jgi:hypothetical protein
MIKDRNFIFLAGLATIAVLAACGGGGSSSLPASGGAGGVGAPAGPPAGQAAVRFSISVPGVGTASNSRRAQFVDPSTQSLTMTLLQNNGVAANGTAQGPFNLTPGSAGCTGINPLVCTFSLNAPIGNDVFLANTFSGPNATGPLGSGAVTLSVVQNATNSANLTLTGPVTTVNLGSTNSATFDTLWDGNGPFVPVPASVLLAAESDSKARAGAQTNTRAHATGSRHPLVLSTLVPMPVASERIFINALDAAGELIINPTQFNQPVQLTLSLNGGTQNVTLADTPPAGLSCPGSGTSTTANGGFVLVCSPSDVVTLTLIPTIASQSLFFENQFLCCGDFDFNFPSLTATLPSAPATVLTTFPFTVEVNPAASPTPTGTS